jgi:hypothetical protein
MEQMGWWREFLDSLATDGGSTFLIYALIVGCLVFVTIHPDAMKAGEVLTGAFGCWLGMIKSRGSNRDQVKPPTSTTSATVTTTTNNEGAVS